MTKAEQKRKKEFKRLLAQFSAVLLKKLMANERKYNFGDSWKLPDWEDQLQDDLQRHIKKGDPRDTAIFSLFAWYHGWSTAPQDGSLTVEQIQDLTDKNMNLIGAFIDHVKTEADIEISEEVLLSFFNG